MMMGSGEEEEKESSYTPKLALFSVGSGSGSVHAQYMASPERSGMLTPPLHASASVPFRWEEEPGKPKPCTALTTFVNPDELLGGPPKCLELPPRLLVHQFQDHAKNNNKLPSPTTVLEGPYMGGGGGGSGRARFQSSSFRIVGRPSEWYGSFRAGNGGGSRSSCTSPDHQLGAMVVSSSNTRRSTGFLGSWRRRAALNLKGSSRSRRDHHHHHHHVGGNSYVFPSSGPDHRDGDEYCSRELLEGDESSSSSNNTSVKITRIKRVGSFSTRSHSKSHFWASIYEGLKQVVPWSKKEKKHGFLG